MQADLRFLQKLGDQMKRMISIVLSLTLVLGFFTVPASADTTAVWQEAPVPKLTVSELQGDYFTASIQLCDENTGMTLFTGITLNLLYDSSLVQVVTDAGDNNHGTFFEGGESGNIYYGIDLPKMGFEPTLNPKAAINYDGKAVSGYSIWCDSNSLMVFSAENSTFTIHFKLTDQGKMGGAIDLVLATDSAQNYALESNDEDGEVILLAAPLPPKDSIKATVAVPIRGVTLTGSIAPETGAEKSAKMASTGTDNVTAAIEWTGDFSTLDGKDVFKGGTAYTAKITLSPREGLAFAVKPTFDCAGLTGGTDLEFTAEEEGGAPTGKWAATKTFAATAAAALNSIKTEGTLSKEDYTDGDTFDPAGLTVKAVYSDGTEKTIPRKSDDQENGYEIAYARTTGDYAAKLQKGDSKVTVRYAENGDTKTTGVAVTVAGKPVTAELFTVNQDALTYTGANQADAVTEKAGVVTDGPTSVAYAVKENGGVAKDPGTYTLTAAVGDDDPHYAATGTAVELNGQVTINKMMLTADDAAAADHVNVVVGDGDFTEPTYSYVDSELNVNEPVPGAVTYSYNEVTDGGKADLAEYLKTLAKGAELEVIWKLTAAESSNFTGAVRGKIKFKLTDMEFKVGTETATAENAAELKKPNPAYGDSWAEIIDVKTISVTLDGETVEGGTFSVPGKPAAGTAQQYTVKYTKDGKEYDVFTGAQDIAKAQLSLTWGALGSAYDGKSIAPNPTLSGYVNNESGLKVTLACKSGDDDLEGAPKDAGTYTIMPILAAGENGATAALDNYELSTSTSAAQTWTIDKKSVSVSGITARDKTYDGTTAATVDASKAVFNGVIEGDQLTIAATGAFTDKNAGEGKTVDLTLDELGGADAGNYTLDAKNSQKTAQAGITPSAVIVSGITAADKPWDGTNAATLDTTVAEGKTVIVGLVSGDDVTVDAVGTFRASEPYTASDVAYDRSNAITAKTVAISGITLGGADAGNYTLADHGQQTETTAKITKVTVATVIADIDDQVYTGSEIVPEVTVTATINGAETALERTRDYTVAATMGENVDNVNASASGKTGSVTIAAVSRNFDLANTGGAPSTKTFNIVPKPINGADTGVAIGDVASHTYDKRAYVPTLTVTDSKIKVGDSGKTLAAGTDYAVTYTVKATGAAITAPTDAGTYTATITGMGNYTGTLARDFEITKKGIQVSGITANDKIYDGTNEAVLVLDNLEYDGVIEADEADLEITGATGTFSDKNVARGQDGAVAAKTVDITGLTLSGAAACNYTLDAENSQKTAQARINPAEVTVSGITASDKTFDNTTAAAVDASKAVFDGLIGNDKLTISVIGAFSDANVGANKTVHLTLGGSAAGNYTLAGKGGQTTAAATITKATRTLRLADGQANPVALYGKDTTAPVTLAPGGDLDGSAAAAITVTARPAGVVSWEGNALTYTIKQITEETGMTTLAFMLPATTNYEAGGSVRVNVTAKAGYDVTIATPVGGSASAKVGEAAVRTAKENDVVTLTATPAVGYCFSNWTATKTGEAGTVVTVTDGKFTMPAYSVTVTPVFAKNDYTIGFDTTDAKISAITAKKSGASVTSANYNDEITLAFTTESSAAVNSATYTYTVQESGENVTKTVTLTPDATGAYRFTMPAQNITVKATAVAPLTIKGHDSKITKIQTGSTIAAVDITTTGIQTVPGATVIVEAAAANSDETLGAITYSYMDTHDTTKTAAVTKTVTESGTTYSFVVPKDVKDGEAITVSATYNDKTKVEAAVAEDGGTVSVAAVSEQGKTEVEVAVNVDETTKQDLRTAAGNVTMTIPAQAAPPLDGDKRAEALAALAQAGLVTVDTSAEAATVDVGAIRVVEKTYPEVKVTDFEETATNVMVKMDITLKKQEVATAAAAGTQLTARNSVDLGAPQRIDSVKDVSVTVGIPDVLAKKATDSTVYVQHTHDGKRYEYRARIEGDEGGYLAIFYNPHGFSEFTLSTESSAIASYRASAGDTRYYPSFATAVADAIDAGVTTITMHKTPKAGDIAQIDGSKAGALTIKAAPEADIDFAELYELTNVKAPDEGAAPAYGKASDAGDLLAGRFRYAPLYSVEISGGSSVRIGRPLILTAAVKDINGNVIADPTIEWASSDSGKGSVSDGTVTGVAAGSTSITATYTADGRKYTGTLAVTVGSGDGGGAVNTAGGVKDGSVTATPVLEKTVATGFVDVPADSFYADAVAWATANGITTGTTGTTFSPDASCTRAQAVTFLYRAAGEPAVTVNTAFADVEAGSYYEKAVAWAVANGITNGVSAAKFDPNAACTRAQIVTFLSRFEKAEAASSVFTDVLAGEFYAGAVGWAVANGITNGVSATTFAPNTACTRGQIVTFLYRDFVG